MFSFFRKTRATSNELLSSELLDQTTFYPKFMHDLDQCRQQVIIESPFMTTSRTRTLLPILQKLRRRGVNIIINTRHPQEHAMPWDIQAIDVIERLQAIGVRVLYTGGHHRKLAILDGSILYEGSLNVLSQNDSCEIMRRIVSPKLAQQMIAFIKVDRFLK